MTVDGPNIRSQLAHGYNIYSSSLGSYLHPTNEEIHGEFSDKALLHDFISMRYFAKENCELNEYFTNASNLVLICILSIIVLFNEPPSFYEIKQTIPSESKLSFINILSNDVINYKSRYHASIKLKNTIISCVERYEIFSHFLSNRSINFNTLEKKTHKVGETNHSLPFKDTCDHEIERNPLIECHLTIVLDSSDTSLAKLPYPVKFSENLDNIKTYFNFGTMCHIFGDRVNSYLEQHGAEIKLHGRVYELTHHFTQTCNYCCLGDLEVSETKNYNGFRDKANCSVLLMNAEQRDDMKAKAAIPFQSCLMPLIHSVLSYDSIVTVPLMSCIQEIVLAIESLMSIFMVYMESLELEITSRRCHSTQRRRYIAMKLCLSQVIEAVFYASFSIIVRHFVACERAVDDPEIFTRQDGTNYSKHSTYLFTKLLSYVKSFATCLPSNPMRGVSAIRSGEFNGKNKSIEEAIELLDMRLDNGKFKKSLDACRN